MQLFQQIIDADIEMLGYTREDFVKRADSQALVSRYANAVPAASVAIKANMTSGLPCRLVTELR